MLVLETSKLSRLGDVNGNSECIPSTEIVVSSSMNRADEDAVGRERGLMTTALPGRSIDVEWAPTDVLVWRLHGDVRSEGMRGRNMDAARSTGGGG